MKKFQALAGFQFRAAVAEGRMFWMRKYLMYGQYSTPQLVTAERAARKASVLTAEGWCPYEFMIAE
jgi:hypothetical protein